jgi:hypothetical protein
MLGCTYVQARLENDVGKTWDEVWTYLVHGIARKDYPAVMPVLKNTLFEGNHGGAGAALSDFRKDNLIVDRLVHDELG